VIVNSEKLIEYLCLSNFHYVTLSMLNCLSHVLIYIISSNPLKIMLKPLFLSKAFHELARKSIHMITDVNIPTIDYAHLFDFCHRLNHNFEAILYHMKGTR
jgi:hypothetical protein